MTFTTDWIESLGGPLLLAPRSSLKDWLGGYGSKLPGLQTDYARACSIDAGIGKLAIGTRLALVLGDEPDRTALLPGTTSLEALIVRWRWASSEDSLLSRLMAACADGALSFAPACELVTTGEEYVLFDSAYSGAKMQRSLSVPLNAGRYAIESALFKPDDETCALVHRLRLLL